MVIKNNHYGTDFKEYKSYYIYIYINNNNNKNKPKNYYIFIYKSPQFYSLTKIIQQLQKIK